MTPGTLLYWRAGGDGGTPCTRVARSVVFGSADSARGCRPLGIVAGSGLPLVVRERVFPPVRCLRQVLILTASVVACVDVAVHPTGQLVCLLGWLHALRWGGSPVVLGPRRAGQMRAWHEWGGTWEVR